MPGTVTIVAARPGFGRAGRIKISVDGNVVATVRQGASFDVSLEPGDHTFRVSSGASRSKKVTLSVADDSHHHLNAGVHPAMVPAVMIGAAALGFLGGLLATLPVAALLIATPGSWLYLRSTPPLSSFDALEDAEEAAVADSGQPWWVNDPNLAKRYRQS